MRPPLRKLSLTSRRAMPKAWWVGGGPIRLGGGAGGAEGLGGGVRLHRIPREGGNTLNGTFFATGATSAMQGNNLTQDLRDRGLPTPDAIDTNWNVNAGFGGPILRDRLWFFGAYQNRLGSMFAGGVFEDRNFNNPAAWTY